MVSSISCTVIEFYTPCYKLNEFSRVGVLLNVRNLGFSQLGFPRNGGNNLFCSRKICCLKTVERSAVNLVEQDSEECSFTVSYLVNSCGLSPKAAISASKKVKIKNSDNPDSVLAVLRDYGFDNTYIAKTVSKYPSVLFVRPETNLIPKLEYFRSLGFKEGRLAAYISSSPDVFRFSLKNRIIPYCDFFKSVLVEDKKVVSALSLNGSTIFRNGVERYIAPNLEILREVGATASVISCMLTTGMRTLIASKFGEGVKEAIKLGFEPSKCKFVHALQALVFMSKSKWEKKVNVFKSWGLSDNDISSAFRKYPVIMLASEKKIQEVMSFLVNELGLEPADVMRTPPLFHYSIKKRLIPRCSVVRVLRLKGLLKNDISLSSCIQMFEAEFLEGYVKKYENQVPELWSLYAGEVGLAELAFGTQEKHWIA